MRWCNQSAVASRSCQNHQSRPEVGLRAVFRPLPARFRKLLGCSKITQGRYEVSPAGDSYFFVRCIHICIYLYVIYIYLQHTAPQQPNGFNEHRLRCLNSAPADQKLVESRAPKLMGSKVLFKGLRFRFHVTLGECRGP